MFGEGYLQAYFDTKEEKNFLSHKYARSFEFCGIISVSLISGSLRPWFFRKYLSSSLRKVGSNSHFLCLPELSFYGNR